MGRRHTSEALASEIQRFTGRRCWSFYVGESTGSALVLDFEPKVSRRIPLLNPRLSEEERYYRGEFSIYIECAWRLDSDTQVVCGSGDSPAEGESMSRGLTRILRRSVESMTVAKPAWDLTVRFGDGLTLTAFCDQPGDAEEDLTDYSCSLSNVVYVVGPRGRVRCEPRQRES